MIFLAKQLPVVRQNTAQRLQADIIRIDAIEYAHGVDVVEKVASRVLEIQIVQIRLTGMCKGRMTKIMPHKRFMGDPRSSSCISYGVGRLFWRELISFLLSMRCLEMGTLIIIFFVIHNILPYKIKVVKRILKNLHLIL